VILISSMQANLFLVLIFPSLFAGFAILQKRSPLSVFSCTSLVDGMIAIVGGYQGSVFSIYILSILPLRLP